MEWVFAAVGAAVGGGAAWVVATMRARAAAEQSKREANEARERALAEAKDRAAQLQKQAELDAKAKLIEAEAEIVRRLEKSEEEHIRRLERVEKREQVVEQKNDLVTNRELELGKRDKAIGDRERAAEERAKQVDSIVAKQQRELERVAGMSADEARAKLVDKMVDEARLDAAKQSKAIEDAARDEAEKRAKRIIGIAIQRFASDTAQERSVTSVALPSDDIKGKIIGREGRNIRALSEHTGCDFIIDDTPETVVISSFDPVRREVARVALNRLIQDGRIHPTRIEEVVAKAQSEVDSATREAGEGALVELGLARAHPEIVKLLGQLKFRYSYAQNVLRHSVECGYLAGLMAGEIGQDVKRARRAALLHDIGKATSHEEEGGHAMIGGRIAKKFGEDDIVVNAIAAHHDDEPPQTIVAHLVAASDALSSARPGARREALESYVKRLEDLEKISVSFRGVERSFALSAGREIRVFVDPGDVSDVESVALSRAIAKRIETELSYPGQIRVTVIRETRAIDYAK
ncbi:MAG: ribonuclease Y [Deltaproteobacteria bacterium]|nr:ribonuclease Y [Deltaproteobacteria bacterium]